MFIDFPIATSRRDFPFAMFNYRRVKSSFTIQPSNFDPFLDKYSTWHHGIVMPFHEFSTSGYYGSETLPIPWPEMDVDWGKSTHISQNNASKLNFPFLEFWILHLSPTRFLGQVASPATTWSPRMRVVSALPRARWTWWMWRSAVDIPLEETGQLSS